MFAFAICHWNLSSAPASISLSSYLPSGSSVTFRVQLFHSWRYHLCTFICGAIKHPAKPVQKMSSRRTKSVYIVISTRMQSPFCQHNHTLAVDRWSLCISVTVSDFCPLCVCVHSGCTFWCSTRRRCMMCCGSGTGLRMEVYFSKSWAAPPCLWTSTAPSALSACSSLPTSLPASRASLCSSQVSFWFICGLLSSAKELCSP